LISSNLNRTTMVLSWLDIVPQPCIYESSSDGPFISFPSLTLLGHLNWAGSPTPLDVYADFYNLWLFMGNAPIGLVDFGNVNLPKVPLPVNLTSVVPPDSVFQIPTQCFPFIGNSNMFEKRMELAVPTFPVSFTMYIVAPSLRSAEIIYYVDLVRQYYRIDYPGYTVLQRDGIRYTFLSETILKPPVCYNITTTDPLFNLPVFSRRLANVTVDGIPTAIWQGISDPSNPPVFNEYWYWNTITNIPVFYIDRMYLGAQITLFESSISNPNIFNQIPSLCIGEPFKQQQILSSILSLREQFSF